LAGVSRKEGKEGEGIEGKDRLLSYCRVELGINHTGPHLELPDRVEIGHDERKRGVGRYEQGSGSKEKSATLVTNGSR